MSMQKTLDHDFFASWSRDMAYVLGFFAADGAMIEHRRGGHYIEFHVTDREILEGIQRVMHSNHSLSVRAPKSVRDKVSYRIQLGSFRLFRDLQALGMGPRKSLVLNMPPVPDEYFGHFVRGYFDGDGCIYFQSLHLADRKNPRKVLQSLFSCGTYTFLELLLARLRNYGIEGGSLKRKVRGNELMFGFRDSVALYRVMYNNLSDSDIYLGRKHSRFTHAIEALCETNAAVV